MGRRGPPQETTIDVKLHGEPDAESDIQPGRVLGGQVSLFEVAKILGHETLDMTMRCAHFAPAAALVSLGGFDRALSGLGVLSSAQVN